MIRRDDVEEVENGSSTLSSALFCSHFSYTETTFQYFITM